MKVLFDARWINPTSPDGITRYSIEMIKALDRSDIDLTLLIHTKAQLEELPQLEYITTNSPKHPSEINQSRRLNTYGFDVVYTPHFLFGGKGREFKLIRTILDLIPFHHKNKQSKLVWKIFHSNMYFLKRLINDSDALVTISETVKKQLQAHTNLQISVVLCAPTNTPIPKSNTKKELLYIGRYEPYKNVETLIKSMRFLPEYKLLLAGNCPRNRKESLSKMISDKDRVEFLGVISDDKYQQILSSAFAMVNASQEEGFGLQLVEAMSAGCPVVCSDIDIFREVVGSKGMYFDPVEPAGLADSIHKLEDANLWQQTSIDLMKYAKRYNWQKSSQLLVKFFKKTLDD